MNLSTTRWLLAPLRQLRTHRLMAQHGPTLTYPTAWALITLAKAPGEADLIRTWHQHSPPDGPPGLHQDRWHHLDHTEQQRRRTWLRRHGHSPIQLLHLDTDLIKTTGIHAPDWGRPQPLDQ